MEQGIGRENMETEGERLKGLCYHENVRVSPEEYPIANDRDFYRVNCAACGAKRVYVKGLERAEKVAKDMPNHPIPLDMTRDEVFEEMARRGASLAELAFSGGGDSGQVEGVRLFDDNDQDLGTVDAPLLVGANVPTYAKEESKLRPATQKELDDYRFIEGLGGPVWEEYGSFAGEFYVEGKVHWSLNPRRVSMKGTQTVEHYEEFDEEIG
jgi:hypothetical protein